MDKVYNHTSTEDILYTSWERSGMMCADTKSDKTPFVITLPPPNVTGQLHLGHAAMLAIEDIMIRFKRMTDHEVVWIPGTDHAAIATENVVLQHLNLKSREEMTRDEFLEECQRFSTEKHDRIVHQIKKMGAWLDWSREAYTFDDQRNFAVNKIFKKLYEDGLIVRGHRMIHWSVGAQSVLADDEVEWEDNEEDFFEFWCGSFLIGTVRAETKCADSPVIVHPTAEYVRAQNSEGKECIVVKKYFNEHTQLRKNFEIIETIPGKKLEGMEFEAETYAGIRKFWVVADEVIDPAFGTGAMTISTAHSPEDFELSQKYGFDLIQKIDFKGKMTAIAGACEGMLVREARKRAGEIMEEKNLLFQKRPHANRIPKCYRSGTIVEPMLSPQWFIAVHKEFTDSFTGKKTTLCQLTTDAVEEGHVKIIPKRFEKMYFQWTDNLRDWCISRQIWWGHQIPVWYDENENIHLAKEQKIIFARHGEKIWDEKIQDFILSEKGKKEVQKLAKKLKTKGITKIISSSFLRAKQTSEIIAKELKLEIEFWNDLHEVSNEKKTSTGWKTRENFSQHSSESLPKVLSRAKNILTKLKKIAQTEKILVVGHSFFTSVLFAQYSGKGKEESFWKFREKWDQKSASIKKMYFSLPPKQKNLYQDSDTLDTWFSSALWPFSTLGWPDESKDFERFYPTDVLETGHDILTFWVLRMIMFGRYATGEYPFHTVYLHGLVCDENGQKMSKSKGNGIDPLEMIEEVGADAVRLSLVIGATPGNPISLGKSKISGYRNFVNKLWNAGRFVRLQNQEKGKSSSSPPPTPQSVADKWILHRLSAVCSAVSKKLEKYEISVAGDMIYHFVWDEFCDWYIEASKVSPNSRFLKYIFLEILKLTHPLCPFVTEALWQELADGSIIEQTFPDIGFQDHLAIQTFENVQKMVTEIRKIRAEKKLNPKERLFVQITGKSPAETIDLIENLAGVECETIDTKNAVKVAIDSLEVFIDVPIDHARIEKEKSVLNKKISSLQARLKNKGYINKAPSKLVEQTKKELEIAKEKLKELG